MSPADTAPPPSLPSRQRRKDARPQELLDAALELFVEKGFAATRAEEVAARAGVSKGTLYLYYPSKEELLKAVIREHLSRAIAEVRSRPALQTDSPSELLRSIYADWWHGIFSGPGSGVFKLIITEVRNFPEIAEFYQNEVVKPGESLIGGLIQRGIDLGEFRPVNVALAVHSLVLPMVMLCLHRHSLGVCAPVEALLDPLPFIRQHVELVIRGLSQAAPGTPVPAK
jgi:AcrR family transcriptional regulator